MDGDLRQPYTPYEGKPEAMTVSCAFFGDGGWLYPQAYGRRNGWTYVESFRQALEIDRMWRFGRRTPAAQTTGG